MLVIAKMLRMSSSTTSTFLPASTVLGLVQVLEHLPPVLRQRRRSGGAGTGDTSSSSRSGERTSFSGVVCVEPLDVQLLLLR